MSNMQPWLYDNTQYTIGFHTITYQSTTNNVPTTAVSLTKERLVKSMGIYIVIQSDTRNLKYQKSAIKQQKIKDNLL